MLRRSGEKEISVSARTQSKSFNNLSRLFKFVAVANWMNPFNLYVFHLSPRDFSVLFSKPLLSSSFFND